jgi:isopenicillin N synthase-like dioxygenase
MGVGYELKKTAGTCLDLKEDFHYTSGMHEWLAQAASIVGNKYASDVVASANSLLNLLTPFITAFAQEVEKEFALEGFAQEIADSQDMWFVRYLHYFGDRHVGDEIATSHADKSGFTLHLYESSPGLQFLDFKKQWKEVSMTSTDTVIIPGMRLQYRSKNVLKALFHRVVATRTTAKTGRFAMVCFVHLKHTPQYNKRGAGRLQEFTPGFNYSMSFQDFAKLFIAP